MAPFQTSHHGGRAKGPVLFFDALVQHHGGSLQGVDLTRQEVPAGFVLHRGPLDVQPLSLVQKTLAQLRNPSVHLPRPLPGVRQVRRDLVSLGQATTVTLPVDRFAPPCPAESHVVQDAPNGLKSGPPRAKRRSRERQYLSSRFCCRRPGVFLTNHVERGLTATTAERAGKCASVQIDGV